MQGDNLESARVEIALDQVARTPKPRNTLKAWTVTFGLFERLVKTILLP